MDVAVQEKDQPASKMKMDCRNVQDQVGTKSGPSVIQAE